MNKRITSIASIIISVLAISFCVLSFASDEITVTGLLKADNGSFQSQRNVSNARFDQTTQGFESHIQSIGTNAHELITINADVATNGSFWVKNITTNTAYKVSVGVQDVNTNFIGFLELEADQFTVGWLTPTNPIYAKASGGTVNLEILVNAE